MKNEAKFVKCLFSIALNGVQVAKYEPPKNYAVMLKVEADNTDKTLGYETKLFRTEDEYDAWIDSVVDDETAIYNKALALSLTLDAMRSGVSEFPAENNGVYGE